MGRQGGEGEAFLENTIGRIFEKSKISGSKRILPPLKRRNPVSFLIGIRIIQLVYRQYSH